MRETLLQVMKQQISDSTFGYISYAEFIELALYHPEYGYYMKDEVKIGREGDFYTSSNISDLYGRLIAKWYGKLVVDFGLPSHVCEIGAGTGRFAKAFIEEWRKHVNLPLTYTLVETSPFHRKQQKENLESFWNETIKQVETIQELKGFDGLVFSNELFDALPVYVIEKVNGDLFEVMVSYKDGQFVEMRVPLANEEITAFLSEHEICLQELQRLEIPLAMTQMISTIADCVNHAVMVTVDYGYTKEEWQDPTRASGSLRGFRKHQLIDNILQNPGEMDITSHVHFDVLIEEGEKVGLHFINKYRQDRFLLSLGILDELQNTYDPNPFSDISKRNRAIRSLIMPGGISPFFHAIIQHKGLENQVVEFIANKKI
jgi:SAM-dependent MidA family methyltransferase